MPYILKDPPGNERRLEGDTVWIGNHPTDDIILNDYSALPRQVEIKPYKQGLYRITNFGAYGILVNGYELSYGGSFLLEEGDEIRIGHSVIACFWEDDDFIEAVEHRFWRGWRRIKKSINFSNWV